MFSIFKNSSTEQDVVLQELTEGQLAQVAGGVDKDEYKKWHHHHHHHHHHHLEPKKPLIVSTTPNAAVAPSTFKGHW